MKTALVVFVVVLALAACSRAERPVFPPASGPVTATPAAEVSAPPTAASAAIRPEDRIVYYPSQDRVLTHGDGSSNDVRWLPLGISLPAALGQVRHALVLTDTPLTDKDGNSKGTLLTAGSLVAVKEIGDWVGVGSEFSRQYRIQGADAAVHGWIDSGAAALILAEEPGLQVGIIPRKVVIGGGESDYSLLVVADGTHVTILDTSYFPFPDEFHPSGVVSVSLQDVNADSRTEIILEAETIISLRYLGATPVRWKAWLRRGFIGALVPIFRYNVSFGSDAGYSYSATDRLFDATGRGRRDTVRVDTEYTLVSGPDEFRTTTVSFYLWNGGEFRRDTLQDLPKLGTVNTDQAALRSDSRGESETVATLSRGDSLYVFDRSDTRQSPDDPASWWYRAVTKSGAEGWINGTSIDLSWIDPLKTNRAAFLAQN